MSKAQSIRQAITLDPRLPHLVSVAAMEPVNFIGFYFDGEEWNYWTSYDAQATATNCYYTPEECRSLLVEKGFPEL